MEHLVVGSDGSQSAYEALRWALDATTMLRDPAPDAAGAVSRSGPAGSIAAHLGRISGAVLGRAGVRRRCHQRCRDSAAT